MASFGASNDPRESFRRVLVTAALPYANGPIHLGHLAGAYLPADVYVRFQRLKGRQVLFICGTDEHGVPITIAAEAKGVTPREVVDHWHHDHKESFARFGISFDRFSRTSLPVHHKTAQDFFLRLYQAGYLVEKAVEQYFCPTCNRFLADRYVEGKCPKCGADGARGDQCERCGSSLSPTDLIEPYCKVCGGRPELRPSTHLFLRLRAFQERLEQWLGAKKNWKDNVLNYCRGWFAEGLEDRAVTRDLPWGVPVPLPGYEGKVIYVWFEAPIGYISATKDWAESIGDPERWREWWLSPDTRLVHFIGKDNIVFHAILWPAMLMGHGEFILPDEIPANEFLNIAGAKLSTSRNYAVWLREYLERFEPDPLRYWLAANAPETKDADFTWEDFRQRNNGELADILGNFVNRTLAFAQSKFGGRVPEGKALGAADREMLRLLEEAPRTIGELLEHFELRRAASALMDLARAANKYFNDQEPWLTVSTDPERCATTINVCLQTVRTLAVLQSPILPFSAARMWKMLGLPGGVEEEQWDQAGTIRLPAGHTLSKPEILFRKIEQEEIEPEIAKLKPAEPKESAMAEQITFEEFKRVQLRTAKVVAAAPVEKTQKLLRLQVDIGGEQRQIVAGIAEYYKPEDLVGKTIVVVANLAPATIRGVESRGMLLAAVEKSGRLALVTTDQEFPAGAEVQ
ncbi:MAG: methionine--tRNA ligase [candidate division KSB1 bacterium]|nr:methionine--tRNA ligase [candidate division KSB1 bacterium]MDZ7294286.1 methionine--tRNA ligase [candidate division KSB1 bacterium]MDZ7393619.1 methionine--tRNA ligase [candidate division KSB1 bacterium]